jgi:hypothetical protein
MSKAIDLIQKIQELAYLGQHNDYSTQPYDNDAAEFMKPFADLQLPDQVKTDVIQTMRMARKSRGEDGVASPNN